MVHNSKGEASQNSSFQMMRMMMYRKMMFEVTVGQQLALSFQIYLCYVASTPNSLF